MRKLLMLGALAIAVSCVAFSCQRTIPDLDRNIVTELKDIPLEYGSLVSVTIMAEYPGWFQLWFQADDGTINIVRIQFAANMMHREVRTIPRSQAAIEEEEGV
jgi:hypothetical protein